MQSNDTFNSRLEQILKSRDMSYNGLAKSIGLGKSSLYDWKKGRTRPSSEAVRSIAAYLNVSSDYLLGLSDNPAPIDEKWAASLPDNMDYEDLPPEAIEEIKAHREWIREKYRQKKKE